MAESILYDLAVGLISKSCGGGVKDELKKLEGTVYTIKAVLLDAEEQSVHNHQVKQWLGMLSEVMYDADDILDEFSYEDLRLQVMSGSKIFKEVRLFFTTSNQFAFGLKMARKLKELRERLDEIAATRRFHLAERPNVERRFVSLQTHSSLPQVVIGREHDKEKILQLLLSSDCAEGVQVVSVVGIGGLGKTTLAQMVYNDDRVKNHFELKMWVCVSDNFDVQLLVKNVLESASGQPSSSTQMDVLKKCLNGHINGRKYLLVLDDIWNEEVNKWSSFIDLFVVGARGSKILITTRSKTVAVTSRATSVHELQGLPEIESWSLFKQVAFKQGQLPNPSLEAMGKDIVAKCCGVPLAIRTIGGLLYSKDPDTEWKLFKDNEFSKIDVFKQDILPILRLSYDHLPSPYKHCFAYCCLFPKDFRIPVDQLMLLWKAQGYLQLTNQSECQRDAGLKYFKDLLRLSFFQDVEEDRFGNIKYCKMHDLIHDLAVSVAGGNFYLSSHGEMTSSKNNFRHTSFWSYHKSHASSFPKMKKMRTILNWRYVSMVEGEADAIFSCLRRLRVLHISRSWISTLPNSIYKMKLLRYLDLSYNTNIEELPNSLASLHNLQGLNLEGCSNLKKWPNDISKLVNLTDVNNGGCDKLNYIPSGIGKLTKLEKLSEFVLAKGQPVLEHGAELDELHSLDNLRGELDIKKLRFVENAASEIREGLLSLKQNLQELRLYWGFYESNDVAHEEMVMEALCPHPNLKVLNVFHYIGLKAPSWLPSIANLVEFTIQECSRIKRLPPLDQLLHLKLLNISHMPKLEGIQVANRGGGSSLFFPSLTHLTLNDCWNLMGFERPLTQELPCFPRLSYLFIQDCPGLTRLPLSPGPEMCNIASYIVLSSKRLEVWHYRKENTPLWLTFVTNLVVVSLKFFETPRLPPFDQLPHLQAFRIFESIGLESIEVETGGGSSLFFPSLIDLTLYDCPNLRGFERLSSLPEEELPCFPCLSKLSIWSCPNLINLPLSPELEHLGRMRAKSLIEILKMPTNAASTLSKLQDIRISNLEDCTENELNDGIPWQSLEALRSVSLACTKKLIALPKGLQYATSLQQLEISDWWSLACMPKWMPKLVALQDLIVDDCPQLEERCKSGSAEDWPLISHIPNIKIGGKDIQRDGIYLL